MVKIVLCDDDRIHLKNASAHVRELTKHRAVAIREFTSAAELLALLESSYCPDIAILDVEMEEMDGIHVAQRLNAKCPSCKIIFLTGFLRYAPEVYATNHTWFVVKTAIDKYLPAALDKAFAALEEGSGDLYFMVQKQRASRKVFVADVLYLERMTYRTRITTVEDRFFVTQAPAALLEGLPEGTFIHCHQSYWVNAAKICAQIGSDFILTNGESIPISRTHKKEAIEAFQRHMGK